jgi:hypothetical protein
MGRPPGALDLTDVERARIRELYLANARFTDIAREFGRGLSTIQRAVRGLKRRRRPKPRFPVGRHAKRNDQILALAEKGWSRARIGEEFGLGASQVGEIVRDHPRVAEMLRRGARPAAVARRFRLELSTVTWIASGRRVERERGTWAG